MHYEEKLGNGLLLRTVKDENDIKRYVAFNTDFNNANEGLNTDCLLRHFPGASYADYLLIEDEQTGEIVATTCLIPWQFSYEGITLRAAQMEQVLSHPSYRRHGLVKILIKRFMQMVVERQYDLSFLWGIPYYYRQYGYSYSIEGDTREALPAWRIPDALGSETGTYRLRKAALEDAPVLTEIYHNAMQSLQFYTLRSQEHWKYLLEWAKFPVQIVEDQRTGQAAGYIGLGKQEYNASVQILESGITNQEVGFAVLRALKSEAGGEMHVGWPQNSTLARLAHTLGSVTLPGGQWLLHIPSPAGFLSRIAPVLERRLAASDCEGLTKDLIINLFRQAYKLCFKSGKLVQVESMGFVDSSMGADGGDLCIPTDAFIRLVFGYRSLDELMDAWPDIVMKAESRHLVDVLFPRIASYFYTTYNFFG